MRAQICKNCRFVDSQMVDYPGGPRREYSCLRYPPQMWVFTNGEMPASGWPEVGWDDWCGEFKFKPKKAIKRGD